jgi:hypothetical protein
MTKLTDLSEQELANLLDLPLDKARKWLEVAKSISDEEDVPRLKEVFDLFGDFESATSLRRSSVEELMGLSAEEVEQLKRTGEFYRRYPYFKRHVPDDPRIRLGYLRELLADEVEFEARYPVAYELLFEQHSAISGLPLASFDARVLASPSEVRILRNDPQASVLAAGWSQRWKRSQDSGDAFSLTFERRAEGDKQIDQKFAPLDVGYMRGVLLAILSREEYAERIATELHNEAVREELRAPAHSQVRITDLRLATAPWLKDPNSLEKALRWMLSSLERPITQRRVLRWKWNLLWEDEEARGQGSEDEDAKGNDLPIGGRRDLNVG